MTRITGNTSLYCLLGHPAHHSRSPEMHNLSFQELGIDAVYLAFDIEPCDFQKAVTGLIYSGVRGMNLTMPFKHSIMPMLDEIEPQGQLAGAVNTVTVKNNRLIGTTTDGRGYIDSLKEKGFDIRGKEMTILGAGGAATAIIAEAALTGVKKIHIGKRKNSTYDDTLDFAKKIRSSTDTDVSVFPMDDENEMQSAIKTSDLLTNATNVGMGDDNRSLVPQNMLHDGLFVTDIIYHPEKTTLLAEAEKKGLLTMNGKYMLLYQGAASFKIWTGQDMPIDLEKAEIFH